MKLFRILWCYSMCSLTLFLLYMSGIPGWEWVAGAMFAYMSAHYAEKHPVRWEK